MLTWRPEIKLAISFSIAQAAKMDVVEIQSDNLQEKTRFLAEELRDTGSIGSLSTSQLSRLMGDLWVWKNKTLLQSNIMEAPDFFWECESGLQKAYRLSHKYFDMDERLDILQQREENLMDFLDLLKDESDHRFSWRRNVLITILVLLELIMQVNPFQHFSINSPFNIFQLIHFYLNHFSTFLDCKNSPRHSSLGFPNWK